MYDDIVFVDKPPKVNAIIFIHFILQAPFLLFIICFLFQYPEPTYMVHPKAFCKLKNFSTVL